MVEHPRRYDAVLVRGGWLENLATTAPVKRDFDAALDLVVLETRVKAIDRRRPIIGRLELDRSSQAQALQFSRCRIRLQAAEHGLPDLLGISGSRHFMNAAATIGAAARD